MTLLAFVSSLPLTHNNSGAANTKNDATSAESSVGYSGTIPIRQLGANPVPNLSLPKSIMSSVNGLAAAGGVVTASPQNLTLYNLAVSMRLIGTPIPHDVLQGKGGRTLSSYSFWNVQAWVNGSWLPLVPSSNNFTLLGTNKTGTFVARTMRVSGSGYSGLLRIFYTASSAGPFRWDLDFVPDLHGQYRLLHTWDNITRYQMFSGSKQFRAIYDSGENYTLAWNDVSPSYSLLAYETSGEFSLTINLGTLSAGSEVSLDPSLVSTSTSFLATALSFQRKVFYEPKWGNYFVFYYNGLSVTYRYSHDGLSWSGDQPMPSNWPAYVDNATSSLAVFNVGQQVIIATGDEATTTSSATVYLRFSLGTISGHTITWGTVQTSVGITRNATPGSTIILGMRYVSVTYASNGLPAFSYNWYTSGSGNSICNPGAGTISSEVGTFITYNGNTTNALCWSGPPGYDAQRDRSVIVPYGLNGRVRVVYQFHVTLDPKAKLASEWIDSNGSTGPFEAVESSSMTDSDEFSAVADANYGTNLVYRSGVNYNITYGYRSPSGTGWTFTKNILPPALGGTNYPLWPTVTVDYSTNWLYVFASDPQNLQVVSKIKDATGTWGTIFTFPINVGGVGPTYLGSNLAAQSATNSSVISLIWTQGSSSTYSVSFASIPIQTGWSPYSDPPDPWDGNGIAPYAQYFSNLGESVSPSSGMLTIRQTDLNIPGRGINLGFTRVYTEPFRFLGNVPYGYESYPWAPMGNGWQLNFPWMTGSPNATYVHLWDGEGYRIPTSFWSGPTSSYDNHQGENFHFSRFPDGSIALLTNTDLSYNFDSNHRLANITDSTGLNKILFSYTSNQISKITDTVGRAFILCYVNGLLHSINQTTTGNCTGGGSIRGVVFKYKNFELTNATDAAGRVTSYSYDSSQWLITRITYPTSWYETYSYTTFVSGTQASIYRVNWQRVNATTGTPVRSFKYTYTEGLGDVVSNSTVAAYDGGSSNAASYTSYAYSFGAVAWNISDSNHNLVRGELQHFNPHGQVASDTIIVYDRSGSNWPPGSYTNYYGYDLWGNQIYSRKTIFPQPAPYDPGPWYHETFSSYYNDGLSPGFSAFQESFQTNQGTAPDNSWSTVNGTWTVLNGVYNGTGWAANQCCTSYEPSFIARADLGMPDVSLRASVFIGKRIDPFSFGSLAPIAGVFTHNPSSTYKWDLVLYNVGAQGELLELLDEEPPTTSIVAQSSCNIASGAWVKFNMTVHGLNAIGSASVPGQTCSVTGQFQFAGATTASATGFGLYSGAYSTLYSNVTVTTVSPYITGTGFSNSFINNGNPNSNIHSALAGTAQMQNGTRTAPIQIESYDSYTPWAGLSQTRQLYNSPGGAQWIIASRTYDSYGNLLTSTDPRGNSTSYAYSTRYQSAYLTSVTRTLIPGSTQIVSSYGYNFTTGTRAWYQEPNGYGTNQYNTTYKYDVLGRVIRMTYPTGDYVNYTYNDMSNYVDSINENRWHTRQVYDGLGRLLINEKFLGSATSNVTYAYNWQDKIVTQTDQLQHSYAYQYDPLGRLIKTTEPNGNVTQILYNDVRSWIKHVDENNAGPSSWIYYSYDRLGRLIEVDDPPTATSGVNAGVYYYDEVGNLRKTCFASTQFSCGYPGSQPTFYNYDNLDRLTQTLFPDNTAETYAYDTNGNLILKVERNSLQKSYFYDSLNRQTEVDANGVPISINDYDGNGNLLDTEGNGVCRCAVNGSIIWTYDARNRVLTQRYIVSLSPATSDLTTTFAYSGETLSMITYPDGLKLNYTYDSLGRVVSVFKSGGSNYATFNYYPTDKVKSITYGSGLYANYTYDAMSRPSNITLTKLGNKGSKTILLSLAYGFNRTGTVAFVNGQVNNVSVSEQYVYDSIQRLTNATLNRGGSRTTLSYQYDSLGNRVWQKQNSTITSYSYNPNNNELTSSTSGSTSTVYSYDQNGNLQTKNVTSSRLRFSWNQLGNLASVSNNTTVQGTYVYDPTGQMDGSKEGTTSTFYGYLRTDTLYQSVVGSSSTDYVFAGGMRIGKVNGTTTSYYHPDSLGSTRLVTSSAGAVLFSDYYQPFGQDNGTPYCSSTCEAYKFTGKPVSQTTGLHYYYHRWYDQSIGRFISPDPKQGRLTNPQTLNLYIYVLDDPTTLKDPSGLDWWNPFTWSQQQQAQAFTIAVIAVSIVVVVATAGVGTPLAAAAIGAAIGASTSTAAYTFTQGSKATLGGAVLSGVTGAVAGAIGGGAGGLALNFVKAGGSLAVGMLAAGAGQAIGTQVGNFIGDRASGKTYNADVGEIFTDVGIGAVTFGVGAKIGIGKDAATMAENRMYSSLPTGESTLDPYLPGSIVQSEIGRWSTAITVAQVGYNVGTQAVGGLIDYFMQ